MSESAASQPVAADGPLRGPPLKRSVADLESDMKTRRNIIVYIATSADGYIARPDGDVEHVTAAGVGSGSRWPLQVSPDRWADKDGIDETGKLDVNRAEE